MPREWERNAQANTNILKSDIAVVIAQTRQSATALYDALNFDYDVLGQRAREFYSNFFALYDSTREQLDADKIQIQQYDGEASELMQEIKSHLTSVNDEIFTENDRGETTLNVDSIRKGFSLYRYYKKCLRQAGMLDLADYSPKMRGIGGKDRADQRG